jgi:hypothetical protein
MARWIAFLLGVSLTLGCGKDDHDAGEGAETQEEAAEGSGDEHAGEESHDLGTAKADRFEVKVTQYGDLKAGGELAFSIEITGGSTDAVRAWIGTKDAKGSMKERVDGGHGHGHVEAPDPLPEGCKLWIEIESASPGMAMVSFDLK